MKKALSILAAWAIALSLTACHVSSPSQTSDSGSSSSGSTASQEEASSSSQGVQLEENLFEVELTIPSTFLEEGTTQEELNAAAERSEFESATLNQDGSVTYVMSNAQHKQMMAELREKLDQTLAQMADPETYPTFTEISANEDYTVFTVKTTATKLGLTESLSTLAFYLCGGMYNAFNGTPADDITVRFVSDATGELIEELHSRDTAK